MIVVRRAEERGQFDQGQFAAFHTFSFDHYRDAEHTGFRRLKALNEERVQPRQSFPHLAKEDAEVFSYVLEGALEERDDRGASARLATGSVRRVHADRGETLAGSNPSDAEPVHFLQVWLSPSKRALPHSEQKSFSAEEKRGRWRLIGSNDGRDGSLALGSDTDIYACLLSQGQRLDHVLAAGRHAWLQVASGAVTVDGRLLTQGDGAAVSDEARLSIEAPHAAEVLLFDLA